jgi:hypothetical protein
MIGFRYEVGGDWRSYINFFENLRYYSLSEIQHQDPAYIFANWLAIQSDLDIWAVNLLCAALFTVGLITFCGRQPSPWLAAIVAVPYLVVVIAMGYTRQAVAIGLVMLALTKLEERKSIYFLLIIAIAALFHKTAVMLGPIGMLSATRNKTWNFIICGLFTLMLFYLLLDSEVDHLVSSYVISEYQSQGAAIRVAMNALPAAIFLLNRKRFALSGDSLKLWTIVGLCSIGFVGLLIVSPSSTAVDRMALYFVPIQVFVLSRLPLALATSSQGLSVLEFCVVAYSGAILFVWLNYAENSAYWIPYQMSFG